MFDRGSEAVREEKGGSGTAESREEEAESGTEHCQKILVCLDFFILTRYYCYIILKLGQRVESFIDIFSMITISNIFEHLGQSNWCSPIDCYL